MIRKLPWQLAAALLSLFALTALTWAQFPPQGPGGPGGRGGQPFDPSRFFSMLSNGKDTITISEVRFMKGPLEEYAKSKGITNGVLTKDQFNGYMEDMRKKRES